MLFPSDFGTSSLQPFHMHLLCPPLSLMASSPIYFFKGLENADVIKGELSYIPTSASACLLTFHCVTVTEGSCPCFWKQPSATAMGPLLAAAQGYIAPIVSYHLLTHVFRFFSMDRCPKWLSVLWLFFFNQRQKKNSSTPSCLQKPPHVSVPYWNILWKGCLHSAYVFLLPYTDLLN